MDEIWFRLTHQIEVLQVEGSVALQQGQQWVSIMLEKLQELAKNACSEEYRKQIKDVGVRLFTLVQKGWENAQMQCYSIRFNYGALWRQMHVSRREVAFCFVGLAVGTFVGYNVGSYWRETARNVDYMKAVICHHFIGIEGASLIDDIEIPAIRKPNELLIQVVASSVNYVDVKICSGYSRVYRRLLNSGRKELPVVLGRECAGIVMEIGQNVLGFDVGDHVFLAVPSWASGTMAEFIVVAENQVARRPKLISFEASACLPYSGCMAWHAIVKKSIIEEGNAKGKRVLVYGGCSPVGCILIQLIKLWGGHVTAVCKLDAARLITGLGADVTISLNEANIKKELDLHDKFHAIFYTGGQLDEPHILTKYLMPHGSLVSTMPEYLMSDNFGFFYGFVFAGIVRLRLFFQYFFGRNTNHWKEGSIINVGYLEVLRELVDTNRLQSVVGTAFRPNQIEDALTHVLNWDAIGGTIVKFK